MRRHTRTVNVGHIAIGSEHPIRVQSMTTTPTLDIDATVRQSIALAQAGCEIVRITAQNVKAAKALGEIRKKLRHAHIDVPLVADIHFLPAAAMEAANHVEKVRINPGNYADKKKFQVREYSDALYEEELQRLHEAFSPIVLRCKELGRAMRIGTNHGSLSDRIMNRYGDTPEGMVESALEFIRIAESHGYHDIILSMKASNPKVMIQAYRLVATRMAAENMHYPLHLGVTEAGDGDDARIKSAIGIGALLQDGLGDTIRVSLTEDPVYEIPVARDLVRKAEARYRQFAPPPSDPHNDDPLTRLPTSYTRRSILTHSFSRDCRLGPMEPPRVIHSIPLPLDQTPDILNRVRVLHARSREARIEGLFLRARHGSDLDHFLPVVNKLENEISFFLLDLTDIHPRTLEGRTAPPNTLPHLDLTRLPADVIPSRLFSIARTLTPPAPLSLHLHPAQLKTIGIPRDRADSHNGSSPILFSTAPQPGSGQTPLEAYRELAACLQAENLEHPIWIRIHNANSLQPEDAFSDRLLEGSLLAGSLLCDGLGDLISIENEPDDLLALNLAYNILQGARTRSTKTEFVACPSCGRTLFDLQSTTQRIRDRTGHLKGVTIAVMGCIVNGPGEMADADFGYVGGAPGKVNLYVGKECVKYHIPTDEAVDELVALIRHHGKWTDPPADG